MKPFLGLIPESSDSLNADSICVKSEVEKGRDVRYEKATVFIVGESMVLKNFRGFLMRLKSFRVKIGLKVRSETGFCSVSFCFSVSFQLC